METECPKYMFHGQQNLFFKRLRIKGTIITAWVVKIPFMGSGLTRGSCMAKEEHVAEGHASVSWLKRGTTAEEELTRLRVLDRQLVLGDVVTRVEGLSAQVPPLPPVAPHPCSYIELLPFVACQVGRHWQQPAATLLSK